jgi:hypothetical protein
MTHTPTPVCTLPHEDVQKFLLEIIDQTNFPGKMAEFVAQVKALLTNAEIPK